MTYSSEVLADSPYLYLRLDESSGTTAADASGNGRNGSYVGSVVLGESGLITDGTSVRTIASTEITVPVSFSAGGDFTVEQWFESTSAVFLWRDHTTTNGYFLWANSASNFYLRWDGANRTSIPTPYSILDGNPHHVVLKRSHATSTLTIYLDGVSIYSDTFVSDASNMISPLHIGRNGSSSTYTPGTFDEFAVYTSALSAARVDAHYDAGLAAGGDVTATLNATAPAPVVSLAATVTPPPITAELNAVAPLPVVSLSADVAGPPAPVTATLNATAPLPSVTLTADVTVPAGDVTATLNATAPAPVVSLEAVTQVDGNDYYPFRSTSSMGYLTLPIPAAPPPHLDPQPVVRYSHAAPALSEANPVLTEGVDYPVVSPVEVGTLHVFVDNIDVTYLGGAPIQATRWSSKSPSGDVSATFEIPSMQAWTAPGEGDLYMLDPERDPKVDVVLVDDLGAQTHIWRGFLSSVSSTVDGSAKTKSHQFIADGTLWQAGYTLNEPPHYMPPTDIGTVIPDLLNSVPGKRWGDVPRVTTGLMTRDRGSGNQSIMQRIAGILGRDGYTDTGGQWTLVEVAPGEFRMQLKAETTTHDYTVTYGAFGITVDLTRDESMRVDVIYGRGVQSNGGQWRGTRFPGLILATPPPYPNNSGASMHLGDSDADTDSGDGISTWQARMVELGYSLTVDGVLNSNDIEVVRRIQKRMGALVDGVIGPQTWAASFNRGPAGIDLTQWREPIAAKSWTQQYLRDPNGVILAENPDYDPTRVQHQIEVDAGVNITWREFQPLGERMLEVEGEPALTGTITMRTDFHEAWRGVAKPGDRVRVIGFQGEDVIVRVANVDVQVDRQGLVVSLTVDERSRDSSNVEAILERNRAALPDPARRPGNPNRDSRNERDRFVQWDIDSPCGFLPRTAVFGGLWVVPNPIPFAEVGRIVKSMLTCTVPFTIALFGLPVKPSQLVSIVGNPHTQTDPWTGEARVAALDRLGWIQAWGSQGERCGYSPNGQESQGATFTGKWEDYGTTDFVSGYPPYVWVALFSSTTGFIGGATGEYGRFYPGTDM